MIQLNSGNVLLKPSHRRQITVWLRRAIRMGQRLGRFLLNLRLSRSGRTIQALATVKASTGNFTCQCRGHDWRSTLQELAQRLARQLHTQLLLRSAAVT